MEHLYTLFLHHWENLMLEKADHIETNVHSGIYLKVHKIWFMELQWKALNNPDSVGLPTKNSAYEYNWTPYLVWLFIYVIRI
jgi:hypothetical protein